MSLEVIDIGKIINREKVWKAAQPFWLEKEGTTFGHLNTAHYRRVKEAKEKLKNQK